MVTVEEVTNSAEMSAMKKTEPLDLGVYDVQEMGTTFVKILLTSSVAAGLHSRHICPFCIYAEVVGLARFEADDDDEGHKAGNMGETQFAIYIAETSPKNNPKGWRLAAARAHNKEQHSLNGNIDSVQNYTSREEDMLRSRVNFWDFPTVRGTESEDPAVRLNNTQNNLRRLFYADTGARGVQGYTNAGTLYQHICSGEQFRCHNSSNIRRRWVRR